LESASSKLRRCNKAKIFIMRRNYIKRLRDVSGIQFVQEKSAKIFPAIASAPSAFSDQIKMVHALLYNVGKKSLALAS